MTDPQVWFVTGASSGFGRAIAVAAAEAGDTVVAAVRKTAALDELVATYPGLIDPVALDVTDGAAVEAAVAATLDRHSRIDVLGFGLRHEVRPRGRGRGAGRRGAAVRDQGPRRRAGCLPHQPVRSRRRGAERGEPRLRRHRRRDPALRRGRRRHPARRPRQGRRRDPQPDTPLRLPLDGDAVGLIVGHLDSTRTELKPWEEVSRGTDFDEA